LIDTSIADVSNPVGPFIGSPEIISPGRFVSSITVTGMLPELSGAAPDAECGVGELLTRSLCAREHDESKVNAQTTIDTNLRLRGNMICFQLN
jgi:hypothetical protein